jgi:glycosyltransferase involved in cell wall biosynthesis
VLSDPAAGERMGKAGRRWVTSRFTWRRAADELLAVYEEVGAGGGVRT